MRFGTFALIAIIAWGVMQRSERVDLVRSAREIWRDSAPVQQCTQFDPALHRDSLPKAQSKKASAK